MKPRESIVQIIARQTYETDHDGVPLDYKVKDEIWGLSNHGRLFQMTPNGWQLRLGELE